MYVAKAGVVTNHAGVIFVNNATMSVPVGTQAYVSTQSNTLTQDVNILETSSHMHKFGTSFTATYTPPGGQAQTLYTTTQWDEPDAAGLLHAASPGVGHDDHVVVHGRQHDDVDAHVR